MKIRIWGAKTLHGFTSAIERAFVAEGHVASAAGAANFGLVQIHGAPAAVTEDLRILDEALQTPYPKAFLVHRPDEVLLHPRLVDKLAGIRRDQFILFGDLVFRVPFWKERSAQCRVIPHPFLDLSIPPSTDDRAIVGTFTSWGEMRKLEHYLRLVDAFENPAQFRFRIGGSGIKQSDLPSLVEFAPEFFVPHFNVQLYHLNGAKRFGESSGSLHRGISVPVIFEANAIEKTEGLHVIKVMADDSLKQIDFAEAARKISAVSRSSLEQILLENRARAETNSTRAFVRSVLEDKI